ncbi:MAG TPA: hypothetical protein VNH82_04395 [Candidatus Dormibacteraeota bacterium]|nr:hypothetical protein [Candidatus Dormibacteraeota bacterium]HVC22651.1 hypothetical protein [Candidatus Dormibacteraeota bacterium]
MATFLAILHRSGPQWDAAIALEQQTGYTSHAAYMNKWVEQRVVILGGPLADEHRVVLALEAESEDAIRATLSRDPWHRTHLRVASIDQWTIRLDSRHL